MSEPELWGARNVETGRLRATVFKRREVAEAFVRSNTDNYTALEVVPLYARPSTADGDVAGLVERLTKDAERLEACAGYAAHFGTPRAEDSSRWNRAFAADLRTAIAALSAPTKSASAPSCVACEDHPAPGNDPCAVCGRSAPTKGDELRKALELFCIEQRDRAYTDIGGAARRTAFVEVLDFLQAKEAGRE